MSIWKNRLIFKRILQFLLIGIIFFYIFRTLYVNYHEIQSYEWKVNLYFIFIALLILMGGGCLFVLGWKSILKMLGGYLSFKKSLRIYFISNLGRYIPGKVWSVVGNVYLCSKQEIPVSISSTSLFITAIMQIISGLVIFFISLMFWKEVEIHYLIKLFPIIPLGLVFLYPPILNKIIDWIFKKLKRNITELKIKYRYILLLVLYWCGLWTLYGLANYFLIISIYRLPIVHLPIVIGVYTFASVIGYLAFFAPGGLGVSEASIMFLLSFYMPESMAAIVALLSRLLRTLCDLIWVLVTYKF